MFIAGLIIGILLGSALGVLAFALASIAGDDWNESDDIGYGGTDD